VTDTGARKLNEEKREARRNRFFNLREMFLKERPGENPYKLIALEERVTVWTVYDVLRGRR
jgi:hypothetical protein